jgi:pilus assembly protein Flp/PilA
MFARFLRDENAATAIEYGLIAALIAIAIIGGFGRAANSVSELWGSNNSEVQKALN